MTEQMNKKSSMIVTNNGVQTSTCMDIETSQKDQQINEEKDKDSLTSLVVQD